MRCADRLQEFYDKGPGRGAAKLTEVSGAATARGEISTPDTRVATNYFIGIVRDNLHLQVVLGLRAPPADEEAETAVTSAVEIFLNGISRRSGYSEQAQ
jgi:AefR-like transcriptional repressor, C-terminal domain